MDGWTDDNGYWFSGTIVLSERALHSISVGRTLFVLPRDFFWVGWEGNTKKPYVVYEAQVGVFFFSFVRLGSIGKGGLGQVEGDGGKREQEREGKGRDCTIGTWRYDKMGI